MLGTGIRTICGQSESGQCNSRAVKIWTVKVGLGLGIVFGLGLVLVLGLRLVFGLGLLMTVQITTVQILTGNPRNY